MFYRRSGGGVTLSGGEILGQADFVGEILKNVFIMVFTLLLRQVAMENGKI